MCQVISAKLKGLWSEDEGLLSFEWVLLVTLLTIGIVSGISAARDAIVDEMGDIAEAMLALDGSFSIDLPLEITLDGVSTGGASDSRYSDFQSFRDCDRNTAFTAQPVLSDGPS